MAARHSDKSQKNRADLKALVRLLAIAEARRQFSSSTSTTSHDLPDLLSSSDGDGN
jgi:hypothetical protein